MIGIISVTYQESFVSSVLYKSLYNLNTKNKEKIKIFNFYNAANCNSQSDDLFFFEKKNIENGGLSLGYKEGILYFEDKDVDFILFLNSDCVLDDNVLLKYINCIDTDFDFYYPNLVAGNNKVSPFNKLSKKFDLYIISWLLIKKEFALKIDFPAHYWLDGIDYYLSEWIITNKLKGLFLNMIIEHNLSIITNYNDTPDWRILNIYRSEKVFLKYFYYPYLIKGIFRALINGRFNLVYKLLKI